MNDDLDVGFSSEGAAGETETSVFNPADLPPVVPDRNDVMISTPNELGEEKVAPDDGSRSIDVDDASDASHEDGASDASHEIALLASAVAQFHERSRAQEDLIERMQLQIEGLRSDQVRALLKPVVVGLAQLHADVAQVQKYSDDDLSPERIRQEFELFESQIVETLIGWGFESVDAQPGQPFDRSIHSAKRRVETSDPTQDNHIATVRRQGFGTSGDTKPTLPAQVDVLRYTPSEPEKQMEESETETEQE